MSKELLNLLLTSPTENEVLEFKEAKNQYSRDKLGQYFSALSNEANLKNADCAWLLFGVRNDKIIVGTSISEERINEYKREIADNTSPTLSFIEIYRIKTPDGDVLMLQIPPAPRGMPVNWKGHYYARNGESLAALDIRKIERIRNQDIQTDWSKWIVEEANLDDLEPLAIQKAKEQYQAKNPHLKDEIAQWDDLTFLNKAKICINGKITRTAILLLGKSVSEHYISPASSKISWILKDRDNIEKDYQHFTCPLIIEVENVYSKIRNLKYRYINNSSLFPDEVDQYDPYIIREALNNCIAHQDYTIGGKINVVEYEDGILVFVNSGSFIPGNIENVINADAPENEYRNQFLANAMVTLNMIDTIGSGIRKMFVIQKEKYFPLPDYDLSNNKVKVIITGKVLDENYAKKLVELPNLTLHEIIMLDKVAKNKHLTNYEIEELKDKQLIEGRKPSFHISSKVANVTGDKAEYIKQRGIDDEYCKKIIIDYLKEFGEGRRSDFEEVLLKKLPDVLDHKQKKNKIKNNLQMLKKNGVIDINGKIWKMSKSIKN